MDIGRAEKMKGELVDSGKIRSAYVFSVLIIILAILASAGGLLMDNLYRDNPFVTLAWQNTDLVTLVVAVPIFTIALILSWRGSQRAHLIWLAMVDYTLYNYAYYLFAAAFNWFFLVYVALFVLSIAVLILGLLDLDVNGISQKFRDSTPVKWISGYMLFVATSLTSIYLAMTVGFIVTGQLPAIVEKSGHPTNVVFALDLSLVVPVFVFAAILLWKRQPWGYVLAAISIVKGTIYNLALTMVTIAAARAGYPDSAGEIPLWIGLFAGSLIASLFLLGHIKKGKGVSHG